MVTQLRHELNDCRAKSPAPGVNRRQSRQARFSSTPAPRYSGKSNWDQYHEKFEAIVCLNGWDDVTAALQLLSHLDGDALNVALLVPESQRAVPEFLMNSLSEHYNSPGRRVEYKRQFQRVVRRSEMVRDRFIDGQADRSLRRHLASLKPSTLMIEMVDSCRIWKGHCEPEIDRYRRFPQRLSPWKQ